MARIDNGIMGGFSGKVGPVIGYQWRGRWCMRARPQRVHNPRTEAQQAHRMVFRDMVRLAGRMRAALAVGLRVGARSEGLTECNLFVKINKGRFAEGAVDYGRLEVSRGPVAPVALTDATVDADGVLHVRFEKNPLHLSADANDQVHVYLYCPALQQGLLAQHVYRRTRKLDVMLPDEWAGHDWHLYAFVRDSAGRTSDTVYLPDGMDVDALNLSGECGADTRPRPSGIPSILEGETAGSISDYHLDMAHDTSKARPKDREAPRQGGWNLGGGSAPE